MPSDPAMFLLRVTEGRLTLGSEAGQRGPEDLEPSIHLSAVADIGEVLGTDGKDYSAVPWKITIDGPGARYAIMAREPRTGIGSICYSSEMQSGAYVVPEHIGLTVSVGAETIRDLVNLMSRGSMPARLVVYADGASCERTPEGPRNRWDVEDQQLVVTEFTVSTTVAFVPGELPTEAPPIPL